MHIRVYVFTFCRKNNWLEECAISSLVASFSRFILFVPCTICGIIIIAVRSVSSSRRVVGQCLASRKVNHSRLSVTTEAINRIICRITHPFMLRLLTIAPFLTR